MRSGRTERSCPNFTNTGPSDSSARRRRSPRGRARRPRIAQAEAARSPADGQELVQPEAADGVDDAQEAERSHGSGFYSGS
jgi:hypothetical protein